MVAKRGNFIGGNRMKKHLWCVDPLALNPPWAKKNHCIFIEESKCYTSLALGLSTFLWVLLSKKGGTSVPFVSSHILSLFIPKSCPKILCMNNARKFVNTVLWFWKIVEFPVHFIFWLFIVFPLGISFLKSIFEVVEQKPKTIPSCCCLIYNFFDFGNTAQIPWEKGIWSINPMECFYSMDKIIILIIDQTFEASCVLYAQDVLRFIIN